MFFRRNKKREIEEDDGKSYANMNVEGMPWYRPPQPTDSPDGEIPQLTPKEYRSFIWGVLKAALLIGAIFAVVFFLFIFILDYFVFGNKF